MGEGERSLCLQAGGCSESDGTKNCVSYIMRNDTQQDGTSLGRLYTSTSTLPGNNVKQCPMVRRRL